MLNEPLRRSSSTDCRSSTTSRTSSTGRRQSTSACWSRPRRSSWMRSWRRMSAERNREISFQTATGSPSPFAAASSSSKRRSMPAISDRFAGVSTPRSWSRPMSTCAYGVCAVSRRAAWSSSAASSQAYTDDATDQADRPQAAEVQPSDAEADREVLDRLPGAVRLHDRVGRGADAAPARRRRRGFGRIRPDADAGQVEDRRPRGPGGRPALLAHRAAVPSSWRESTTSCPVVFASSGSGPGQMVHPIGKMVRMARIMVSREIHSSRAVVRGGSPT